MTFFNKKTEVMQIEMTPYGRYLYSIGKFKPHSYEFVDDDVLYKASGSTESQEDIHNRILNDTPKLKSNRSFQRPLSPRINEINIETPRIIDIKMNHTQNGQYALGRSSYSSDMLPHYQVTMIKGEISGSKTSEDVSLSGELNKSGSIFIPQIDLEFKLIVERKNEITDPIFDVDLVSETFSDGDYLSLSYDEPIIHLKEFNSFYEKENFEIEIFEVSGSTLIPKKQKIKPSLIVENMLLGEDGLMIPDYLVEEEVGDFGQVDSSFSEYYFDLEVDEDIPREILCQRVRELEINDQFIDEELICPDVRTDRFNIYATNIRPDDLEDCD